MQQCIASTGMPQADFSAGGYLQVYEILDNAMDEVQGGHASNIVVSSWLSQAVCHLIRTANLPSWNLCSLLRVGGNRARRATCLQYMGALPCELLQSVTAPVSGSSDCPEPGKHKPLLGL